MAILSSDDCICIQQNSAPSLDGLSLYQLTFGREPQSILNIETDPNIAIPGSLNVNSVVSSMKVKGHGVVKVVSPKAGFLCLGFGQMYPGLKEYYK